MINLLRLRQEFQELEKEEAARGVKELERQKMLSARALAIYNNSTKVFALHTKGN